MAKGFHPVEQHSSDSLHPSSLETNNTSTQHNMNSLPAALALPVNQMAIPIYTAATQEEVRLGGSVLFHEFIHRELENEGLSDDELLSNPPPDASGDDGPEIFLNPLFQNHAQASTTVASTPQGYTPSSLINVGLSIRELADAFALSTQRENVRREADEVDLSLINRESFLNMLNIIFTNGLNKHGIVVLFFFCSDVLKRCVRQQLTHIGTELFWWSLRFIADRVCNWVYENGGWEKVFTKACNVMLMCSAILALSIFSLCGFAYIRKNW